MYMINQSTSDVYNKNQLPVLEDIRKVTLVQLSLFDTWYYELTCQNVKNFVLDNWQYNFLHILGDVLKYIFTARSIV